MDAWRPLLRQTSGGGKALRFIAQFRDDLLSRKNTDMWMEALLGNHDQAHPMKRNNLRSLRNFNRVFDSVQTVARYSLKRLN